MKTLSFQTRRVASVLTAACLLLLASCGRDTVAPAAPEDSVSALGGGLAQSNDRNEQKKNDDKKGDDRKDDDKKHEDKKHDDDHGNNDDRDPGLVVATAPGGAVAGVAFTVQPVIELRNHGGNLVMGSNKSVTVSIVGSSVVLGGTRRVNLVRGVASFTDLFIPTAGTYTLLFTSDSYTPVRVSIIVSPRTVDLTVSTSGTGSVTSDVGGIACPGSCSASYDAGTVVSLTAHPSPALSTFTGWSGACTGSGACQVTMDAAKSVIATFAPITSGPPALTMNISGNGTIAWDFDVNPADGVPDVLCSAPGPCTYTGSVGEIVILFAVPNAGSSFAGWTGNCLNGNSDLECDVSLDASTTVTANFTTPLLLALNNTSNFTGFPVRARAARGAGTQ